MGIVNTVREVLQASSQTTNRGDGDDQETPTGSYWCDDCTERIIAEEADEQPPSCPSCGEDMRLDRSPGSTGCAC